MDARPTRADELHHLGDAGGDPRWSETFVLELAAADAAIAAYLIVSLRPSEGRSWFAACITGRDRPLVAVVEQDVPLPRRSVLELRAPGLWTDVECETPGDHVSVGLEAFGILFDAPDDAVGDGRGARTPVGFDLEWETEGRVTWHDERAYEMPCRVTGELLVGIERFELDVTGRRAHCWGAGARDAPPDDDGPPERVLAVAPVPLPRDAAGPSVLRSTVVEGPDGARWVHRVTVR